MGQVNLIGKIVLTLTVSSVLLPLPLFASEVYFNAAGRAHGYTLELNNFALGVQAGALTQDAKVRVVEREQHPALPDYLQPVSSAYYYKLFGSKEIITKPFWLAYSFSENPTYQRSFYIYNRNHKEWRPLLTTLDLTLQQTRASKQKPAALVVVADDTRSLFGPTRKNTFTDFGDINAAAAIALDVQTGHILYEKKSAEVRSIASLTKLMTAYVLLNYGIDLSQVVTYHSAYDRVGGSLQVHEGETMTLENLMYAMIVGSANNAAVALVNETGFTQTDFVQQMNTTASQLGLSHMTFADPAGLEVNNFSTAYEYAQFLRTALANSDLLRFSTTKYYSFSTINTQQFHDFNNTNPLLQTSSLYITGSKTGYIDEALYCLALQAKEGNHEVITVVLGSATSGARFNESERLMKWALSNYQWAE